MSEKLLEAYIVQHMECYPGPTITFSWHGGEPTLLGLDFFRKVVELQHRHQPPGRDIINGIQTNGTLLDENWCRFLADEGFGVGLSVDGPQALHDRYRLTRRQEHALCVFRKTCGDIPVMEHNGDVYSCDHFVTPEHRLGNIQETRLVELMESPAQKAFGQVKSDALNRACPDHVTNPVEGSLFKIFTKDKKVN